MNTERRQRYSGQYQQLIRSATVNLGQEAIAAMFQTVSTTVLQRNINQGSANYDCNYIFANKFIHTES